MASVATTWTTTPRVSPNPVGVTPETTTRTAAVPGGTRQDITDAGCGPHDPALYHYHCLAIPCSPTHYLQSGNNQVDVDDWIQQYHRDGYLVLDQAFGDSGPALLGQALHALVTGTNARFVSDVRRQVASGQTPSFTAGQHMAWMQYEAGTRLEDKDDDSSLLFHPTLADRVRKLMGFVGYEPAIDAIVHDAALLGLVARLLGCQSSDELELFQAQALLKPACGGREKPWHQDNAFMDLDASESVVVGCWIAVDEATPDNGCLRMLRGGHQAGPRMHFAVRDYQLCDAEILNSKNREDVVAVALPPGGIVLFNGMIPHGTPTNTTNKSRRALQFHWVKKGSRRVKEHEAGGRAEVFGGAPNGLTC